MNRSRVPGALRITESPPLISLPACLSPGAVGEGSRSDVFRHTSDSTTRDQLTNVVCTLNRMVNAPSHQFELHHCGFCGDEARCVPGFRQRVRRAVRRLRRAISVAGEPVGEPLRRLRLGEMFFKCPSLRRGETETARAVIGPLTKSFLESLSPV